MKRLTFYGMHMHHLENENIDKFLLDIKDVCKKHNLSISHEDGQGAFEIKTYNESLMDWLMAAHDLTK